MRRGCGGAGGRGEYSVWAPRGGTVFDRELSLCLDTRVTRAAPRAQAKGAPAPMPWRANLGEQPIGTYQRGDLFEWRFEPGACRLFDKAAIASAGRGSRRELTSPISGGAPGSPMSASSAIVGTCSGPPGFAPSAAIRANAGAGPAHGGC